MFEKLPFEEVEHNPEDPLPEDHITLLADLLRYCAEVMIHIHPKEDLMNEWPPGTEMDHMHISAFENAMGLLEGHGLAIPMVTGRYCPSYRLSVPCDQFPRVLGERHGTGELKFNDFNRALEAPLHLSTQVDARACTATIARIIEGLRNLGLVEGPQGASVWAYKVLLYVWFSAYGKAVEAASYSGSNEFERFYGETQ